MALQTHTWEKMLLALAHEAYTHGRVVELPRFDHQLLAEAYAYCNSITRLHSRSFHMASGLLPLPKRQAVRALYAFCRVSDDIVDCPVDCTVDCADKPQHVSLDSRYHQHNTAERLEQWRSRVISNKPDQEDLVAMAWTDTRLRFRVPQRYAEQLIDGVARDLAQNRYDEFSDLASYCYGVASTVGLMSMHIIGYSGAEAIPYAIKLGVALQVTNILRDIADDFRADRVYLPQSELAEFNLSDEDIRRGIETGIVTPNWRAFMQFQIERTRMLYAEAMPGIQLLDRDGQFSIRAAAELYQGILKDIEKHDYDVFTRRAYVSTLGKLSMLPGIWWRTRNGTNQ